MTKTNKWKEGREIITCIDCHPPNTTFTHSLSFTLMSKPKTRRGRTTTTNPKTKLQQLVLNSGSASTEDPWGAFIGTRAKGAT